MVPYSRLPRMRARGAQLLRLPVLQPAPQDSAALAAVALKHARCARGSRHRGTAGSEYLRADGARIPVPVSAAMVEPQYGEFVAVIVDYWAETAVASRAARWQSLYVVLLTELPTRIVTFDGERCLTHCDRALGVLLDVSCQPFGNGFGQFLGPGCEAAVARAVTQAVGGETVRLAFDLQTGEDRHSPDPTLIPRCRDGATVDDHLAVLRGRLPQRSREPALRPCSRPQSEAAAIARRRGAPHRIECRQGCPSRGDRFAQRCGDAGWR